MNESVLNSPPEENIREAERRKEEEQKLIEDALNQTREKIKKLATYGNHDLLQKVDVSKLDEGTLVLFEKFLKGELSRDVVQKNMELFSLSAGKDAMHSFRMLRYMKHQLENSFSDRR